MTKVEIMEKISKLELNPQGEAYLGYLNTLDDTSTKEFKVQVLYVVANAHARDAEGETIKRTLDSFANYGAHDYCRICGNRDAKNFVEHNKEVCDVCYIATGEPKTCVRCDKKTYEGDEVMSFVWTKLAELEGLGTEGETAEGLDSFEIEEHEDNGFMEAGKYLFHCERCLDKL